MCVQCRGIHVVMKIPEHQFRIFVLHDFPFGNAHMTAHQDHEDQHRNQGDPEQVLENVVGTFQREAEEAFFDGVLTFFLLFGKTQFPNIFIKQVLRIGDLHQQLFDVVVDFFRKVEFFLRHDYEIIEVEKCWRKLRR